MITVLNLNIRILIILALGLISCNNKSDEWFFKEVGSLLWVNAEIPDSIIKTAVKETLENSSIIISQITWSPNDSNFIKNVKWYHSLSIESGKTFMLNIDWQENNRSNTRNGWSFENEEIRIQLSNDIKQLVELYTPDYLTLGVEVNYYALTSPTGYKSFIKMFNELKPFLKAKKPLMKIGLSFQLELLYGVHKEWHQKRALEPLFAISENLDYIGISTYPDVLISKENKPFYSIDYLDSLKESFNKPIGITETGLSSDQYTDTDRTIYIKSIYKTVDELDLKFIIWGSMIDDKNQNDWKNKLGLIYSDGKKKPEFEVWKILNHKILEN